jgi:hypothetical protein
MELIKKMDGLRFAQNALCNTMAVHIATNPVPMKKMIGASFVMVVGSNISFFLGFVI